MPEPAQPIEPAARKPQAGGPRSRLARRVRHVTRKPRKAFRSRTAAVRRLAPRHRARIAAENTAFVDELTTGPIAAFEAPPGVELRSLELLRELTRTAFGPGTIGWALRTGTLRWTARRTRLREAAVAAGWEALELDAVTTAQWLADEVLRQQPRHRPAQDLQAALSARFQDASAALTWQRRRLRVPRQRTSPAANAWVHQRMQLATSRRLVNLVALEEHPGARGPGAGPAPDDPESLWAAVARQQVPPEPGAAVPAVLAALDRERQARVARRYLEAFVGGRLARREATARYRPLLEQLSRLNGNHSYPLAAPEVARSVRSMSLEMFRHFVSGKSICLVANSAVLNGSGLGPTIDSYDLVMRFNSFVLDAADTGTRTDVHVTIHLHDYNWDVPVPVRIVISGKAHLWRRSLKQRLRPGAQEWVGDSSLRWPGPSLGLIGPDDPFRLPTAGFQFLRLLMHLDVSRAIDLIGFDFYESGKLRLADAMAIPHSPGHDSAAERDWVLAHAVRTGPLIISMREEGLA